MIALTGGAEYPRNHYFSLHWNTYSIGETNYRCYNYNEFPDRKIVQRLSDGYIDVSFYATNFIKSSPQQLGIFMKTFLFYVQLMLKDKDITRIGYVYLLKFKTYFKIGKTINFEKRYDVSTKKNLISIIPVSNHDEVEKVLIKAYKNKNYKLYKGNEYFIYDNFNDVERIFNDVVLPYKSVYDHRSSNLIHFTKLSNGKLKSWIHPTLCEIFNNKCAKSENERLKLNNCTELISKQISNGYFDEIYDKQARSVCSFWSYFGYITIKRWSDQKINASRLFKSIRKVDGETVHRSINDFIKECNKDELLKKDFKLKRPESTMFELYINKEQPYLSGYMIDILLIPIFAQWASTKHKLHISEILLALDVEETRKIVKPLNENEERKRITDIMKRRNLISINQSYGLY